jgi:molybdopterin-guanine dinucleotide biosynthesis protein A
MTSHSTIAGVILAGGSARRLFPENPSGGDKGLADLDGQPMLAHIIARFRPQVSRLILNINGPAERFSSFGLDVVADEGPGEHGPLAGLVAALTWTSMTSGISRLATVSTDVPFLPVDLVARLAAASEDSPDRPVIAISAGRRHPTIALWPAGLEDDARKTLHRGELSVDAFAKRHGAIAVSFPMGNIGGRTVDPFFNANTPDDLAAARALLDAQS